MPDKYPSLLMQMKSAAHLSTSWQPQVAEALWNASTISWSPQTLWFSCRNGLNEVQLVVTLSRTSYAWVFWPSKVCQRIILTGCIICLIRLVTSRFQKYSMSTWTHGPYFKLLILSNLSQPQKKTGISRNCTRKSRTLEGKWALASRSLCSSLSKWRGKVPNAGTLTKASCLVLHHCPPPEASRIQGFRSDHDIIFNHLLNAFLQLELLIVLFIKKFASQNPRQLQEVSSHPFKIPQVLRLSLPLRPA